MEEKWVIYKDDSEGIEFLFDITNKGKVQSTCYVENAMSFPNKEVALKMIDVVEAMSEKWFNSSVAQVKLELKIEK